MEIQGQIKHIGETQKVSDRFQKREIVITTEASTPYPQHVSFQLTQDKCDLVNGMNIGDEVKAQFNLRGREWNGPEGVKYFNTLEIWRIEKMGGNGEEKSNWKPIDKTPSFTGSVDDTDLPF